MVKYFFVCKDYFVSFKFDFAILHFLNLKFKPVSHKKHQSKTHTIELKIRKVIFGNITDNNDYLLLVFRMFEKV